MKELRQFLELNDNINITYQNLWNAMKAGVQGKFIAVNAYIIKIEWAQINILKVHLKVLEKQEKSKPRACSRKVITNTRGEVNEIETKSTNSEPKRWFFE